MAGIWARLTLVEGADGMALVVYRDVGADWGWENGEGDAAMVLFVVSLWMFGTTGAVWALDIGRGRTSS
jgi:hypothetical protein